jgi:uncharacterized protein YebE (UPF0316 family)
VSLAVLGYCALIFGARIVDVTCGTIRTIFVVYGRRGVACVLGFFEVLVWILVVSKVVANISGEPAYAIAYALGYATGNFFGITIEKRLAFGEQVVRVFSRLGVELAECLRERGFRVTVFVGEGRDGPVEQLFIQTPRRQAQMVVEQARKADPECFIVVDDIRSSHTAAPRGLASTDWRGLLKRK